MNKQITTELRPDHRRNDIPQTEWESEKKNLQKTGGKWGESGGKHTENGGGKIYMKVKSNTYWCGRISEIRTQNSRKYAAKGEQSKWK